MNRIRLERLRNAISSIQEQISCSIDNINCGGCIHFAYYLSSKLTQLGINHGWCFEEWPRFDYDNLRKEGCNHVLIYIPLIGFVDGEETFPLKEKEINGRQRCFRAFKKIDLKDIDEIRYSPKAWNVMYDTNYNSKLKSIITKYLENV